MATTIAAHRGLPLDLDFLFGEELLPHWDHVHFFVNESPRSPEQHRELIESQQHPTIIFGKKAQFSDEPVQGFEYDVENKRLLVEVASIPDLDYASGDREWQPYHLWRRGVRAAVNERPRHEKRRGTAEVKRFARNPQIVQASNSLLRTAGLFNDHYGALLKLRAEREGLWNPALEEYSLSYGQVIRTTDEGEPSEPLIAISRRFGDYIDLATPEIALDFTVKRRVIGPEGSVHLEGVVENFALRSDEGLERWENLLQENRIPAYTS